MSDGAGVLAAICRMKRHERLEIGGTKAELDRLSGGRKLQQDRLTVRGHATLDELDRRKIDAVLLHDRDAAFLRVPLPLYSSEYCVL